MHGKRIDHYAGFPEALVEPCILAGTSEQGCCPECGAPWVRIIEHQNMQWKKGPKRMGDAVKGRTRMGGTQERPAVNETRGWQPACRCEPAQPIPCTVLDPFIGSGTTAVVAQKLGRRAIGVDLKREYLEMAARRLEKVPLPMNLINGDSRE